MDLLSQLHHYSKQKNPYQNFWIKEKELYQELKLIEQNLNFPQVQDDVGILLAWLSSVHKPDTIFEMGSGYGGSAFWFLSGYQSSRVYLTEKRDDLLGVFEKLPWPEKWKESLEYFQGDAFECLSKVKVKIDLALVDGVKADYLNFLIDLHPHLTKNALVIVDNTFLKGKIVDSSQAEKRAPKAMIHFHEQLSQSALYRPCFLPFNDGITLLCALS